MQPSLWPPRIITWCPLMGGYKCSVTLTRRCFVEGVFSLVTMQLTVFITSLQENGSISASLRPLRRPIKKYSCAGKLQNVMSLSYWTLPYPAINQDFLSFLHYRWGTMHRHVFSRCGTCDCPGITFQNTIFLTPLSLFQNLPQLKSI